MAECAVLALEGSVTAVQVVNWWPGEVVEDDRGGRRGLGTSEG